MPETAPATVLGTPPLRTKWQDAKKKSEEAAAKSKETAKLADFNKTKVKGTLGPDLDAWPKNYPQWDKLQSEKTKIDTTIHNYSEAIKKSGLSEAVTKPMTLALTQIKADMDKRLKQAKELVESDVKLATEKSKKAISPIIVFQLDVAKKVAEKAGKTKLTPVKIGLEVILSDDKVLKNVPNDVDNGLLAQRIRDKASFSTVIEQFAQLLKSVDNLEVKAAEDKFEEGMDKIIEKALERAAEPILELVEVRSDYRMYKIKKGATLALSATAAVGGVVGLALTPFTGGVSTIAGIIGIVKAISNLATEASNLAMKTEEFIGKVTVEVRTLYKEYENVKKTGVGAAEMGKTTVNSLVGPFFTTIKSAKADCEQAESKINGLDVKANDESQQLGKLLAGQKQLQTQLAAFDQATKNKLNQAEKQKFAALTAQIDKTAQPVDALIKSITALGKRVDDNKAAFVKISGSLKQLAAKEPLWAQVGEILIQAGASVGLMVAGSVNVPEPMEAVALAKEVIEHVHQAVESLETAHELGEGLNDLIAKHA